MSEPDNDLMSLWQAQPVSRVDLEKIQRDYRSQTIKQRCYMLLDILGMMPLVLLVWYTWDDFSTVAAGMIVALGIVMLPVVGYLIWLRRVTAFGRARSTSDYLQLLTRQMKNNARIAWLTKHSAWLTSLFIVVFYLIIFLQGELPEEKYTMVGAALTGICLLMAGFYRWAQKREQRFMRQFEALVELATVTLQN